MPARELGRARACARVRLRALLACVLLGRAAAQCAEGCNGQGVCGPSSACACFAGYGGPTCADRVCPMGAAWAAPARGARARVAHGHAECSAAGSCQRATGLCVCLPGFSGEACETSECAEAAGLVRLFGMVCVARAGRGERLLSPFRCSSPLLPPHSRARGARAPARLQ